MSEIVFQVAPKRVVLNTSEEFIAFIDELAAEMGKDRGEVIRLSLGLMRIAQDAKKEGNGIAVITPDFEIDLEIVGF